MGAIHRDGQSYPESMTEHDQDNPPARESLAPATVTSRTEFFDLVRAARTVFSEIGDGLFAVDRDGTVLFANEAAKDLLGNDILTRKRVDWAERFVYLLSDGARPPAPERTAILRALNGETLTREVAHISGPGIKNVWLSVTSRPIWHDGQFQWTYIIVRDINLRVWAEQGLRLRDRAIASASEGISIVDAQHPNQPVIYVNDGVMRLTGYDRDDLIGKNWWFLIGEDLAPEDRHALETALADERPCTVEARNRRRNGNLFWNHISLTPVRDSAGNISHFIILQSDVTERVETEERLLQATEDLRAANAKITRANERMRENIEAAARLQQELLPQTLPEAKGFRFAWDFRPSQELSGDLLNVVALPGGQIGLYILDVTGHGVASAMLSVTVNRLLSPVESTSSLVLNRTRRSGEYAVVPPGRVAARLAKRFQWDADTGLFFTLIYGVLDTAARTFRYVSAGHLPPLMLRADGTCVSKKTRNLPIGVRRGKYGESTLRLEPGARLFLYSDGIIEAMNPRNELFGQGRMIDALRQSQRLPLRQSVRHLMWTVDTWRDGGPPRDDISILAVEVAAE